MSTSSCPQCGKQVTIPSGVGTSAKVRCPLCHSQYTLADALVNMPPLLELVDDAPLGLPDSPADEDAGMATVEGGFDATLDFVPEVAGNVPSPVLPEEGAETIEALDEESLDLEASPGHDDLTVKEQDTEIEELSFSAAEPLASETPELADATVPVEAQESVFDFEEEAPHEAGNDLEGLEDLSDAGAAAGDEMAVDFGEPATRARKTTMRFNSTTHWRLLRLAKSPNRK